MDVFHETDRDLKGSFFKGKGRGGENCANTGKDHGSTENTSWLPKRWGSGADEFRTL